MAGERCTTAAPGRCRRTELASRAVFRLDKPDSRVSAWYCTGPHSCCSLLCLPIAHCHTYSAGGVLWCPRMLPEDGDRAYGGRDGESARRSTSCRLSRGGTAPLKAPGKAQTEISFLDVP